MGMIYSRHRLRQRRLLAQIFNIYDLDGTNPLMKTKLSRPARKQRRFWTRPGRTKNFVATSRIRNHFVVNLPTNLALSTLSSLFC